VHIKIDNGHLLPIPDLDRGLTTDKTITHSQDALKKNDIYKVANQNRIYMLGF